MKTQKQVKACLVMAFVITLIFFSIKGKAQENFPNIGSYLMTPGLKYQDILPEINNFIDDHISDTAENDELRIIQRWKWYWENRINGGDCETPGGFNKLGEFMAKQMSNPICGSPTNNSSNWKLLGPVTQPSNSSTPSMGIIVSVAEDPSLPNVIYAGTSKSGCWKSINGGATWNCITDNLHLPGLGINDIKIDPLDPNIIYIATGFISADGILVDYGVGVLKSIDGGLNWNQTGLTFNPFNSASGSKPVRKLSLYHDLGNSAIIYALVGNEVWKSINDGLNFNLLSNSILAQQGNINRFWRDIELNPSDPNTIYISSDCNPIVGSGAALWKSIDAGLNWTPLNNYANNQVSDRISIAVSPSEPNSIWQLYATSNNSTSVNLYLRKSLNEGITWQTLFNQVVDHSGYGNVLAGTGYWSMTLCVSTTNPQLIFIGGFHLNKSVNGGTTFTTITSNIHPDTRVMKIFNVAGNDELLVGNDGGIMKSTNQGNSWTDINGTGLAITQFYGMCSPENNENIISAGAQDNGYMTFNKNISSSNWKRNNVGDAYDCVCDKNFSSTQTLYGEANGGTFQLYKSINSGSTWSSQPNLPNLPVNGVPSSQKYSNPFAPIVISESNGNYYVAGHDLYKSTTTNILLNNNPGTRLSDFRANSSIPVCKTIKTFAVAPSNSDVIYLAYDLPTWNWDISTMNQDCIGNSQQACAQPFSTCSNSHVIFRTSDGGITWEDIGQYLGGSGNPNTLMYARANSIIVDPNNPERAWFGFSALWDDNGVAKNRVNFYNAATHSWSDVSVGLTSSPINKLVYQNGSKDAMYAATDVGVFYTNSSKNFIWECFNNNFPTAIVTDLEINYCNQIIRASTFGRGIWESNLEPGIEILDASQPVQTWIGTLSINTDIVIPIGVSLTIDAATVNIASGRKIIVNDGAELHIINSTVLKSCANMWHGIVAEKGAKIYTGSNSTIEDALYGIEAKDGSEIYIDHTTFNRCYIGIYTPWFASGNSVTGYISGCTFKCDGVLKPNFTDEELIPIVGTNGVIQGYLTPQFETYAGIRMDKVTFSINGGVDKNTFIGKTTLLPSDPSVGGMNAGIIGVNSTLNVTNCVFENIIDRNYYHHYSAGIYMIGKTGSNSLNQLGFGNQPNSIISFEKCTKGIVGEGVNMDISENRMNNVDFGVRVSWAHNKSIQINNNRINSHWIGIFGEFNDGASGIDIMNNEISVGLNSPSYYSSGWGGIVMQEFSLDNPSTYIRGNNIHINKANTGISLSNVKNAQMSFNNIYMDNVIYNKYGVVLKGCIGNTFECSSVISTNGISTSNAQRAIYLASTRNSNIGCNSINETYCGIRVDGICLGTYLTANDINNHVNGLYIGTTGILSNQFNRGNKWHIASQTGFDAVNMGNPSASKFYLFNWYQPLKPTTIWPVANSSNNFDVANWFIQDNSNSTITCSQSQLCTINESATGNGTIDVEREIASGEIYTPEYTLPMDREARQYLFDKLNSDNNLLMSDPEFQAFYAGEILTNTQDFENIADGESMLNNMTVSLHNQIDQNAISMHQNLTIIDQNNILIQDPNTSDSIRTVLEDANRSIYLNIENDNIFMENAIAAFNSNRILDANTLRLQNNGIVTNASYEENEVIVNNTYLRLVEQNDYTLTKEEETTILNIALQCPFSGGLSVYKARNLYALIDPMQTYDDDNICLNDGVLLRQASSNQNLNPTIFEYASLFPNPATSSLNVSYELGKDIEGNIEIYNSYGQKVKSSLLKANEKSMVIDVKSFAIGIYSYTVKSTTGYLQKGKLVISR